jgi:hypothetical protein
METSQALPIPPRQSFSQLEVVPSSDPIPVNHENPKHWQDVSDQMEPQDYNVGIIDGTTQTP